MGTDPLVKDTFFIDNIPVSGLVHYAMGKRYNGVYKIKPGEYEISAYCDMLNGGWTVIDPNRDQTWLNHLFLAGLFADGLAYSSARSQFSWRNWFRLSTNSMKFATSPNGKEIERINVVYRMSGDYYDGYWIREVSSPWLISLVAEEFWDSDTNFFSPDYKGAYPSAGINYLDIAPSIGADGTHCIAYIENYFIDLMTDVNRDGKIDYDNYDNI